LAANTLPLLLRDASVQFQRHFRFHGTVPTRFHYCINNSMDSGRTSNDFIRHELLSRLLATKAPSTSCSLAANDARFASTVLPISSIYYNEICYRQIEGKPLNAHLCRRGLLDPLLGHKYSSLFFGVLPSAVVCRIYSIFFSPLHSIPAHSMCLALLFSFRCPRCHSSSGTLRDKRS
jgi:hypothetical protein